MQNEFGERGELLPNDNVKTFEQALNDVVFWTCTEQEMLCLHAALAGMVSKAISVRRTSLLSRNEEISGAVAKIQPTYQDRPDLYECESCSAKSGTPVLCDGCCEARDAAGDAWVGPRYMCSTRMEKT